MWLGDPGECFVDCADLIEPIIIHLLSLDLCPRSPLFPPFLFPYTILLSARFLDTLLYLFVRSPPPPVPSHLLPFFARMQLFILLSL